MCIRATLLKSAVSWKMAENINYIFSTVLLPIFTPIHMFWFCCMSHKMVIWWWKNEKSWHFTCVFSKTTIFLLKGPSFLPQKEGYLQWKRSCCGGTMTWRKAPGWTLQSKVETPVFPVLRMPGEANCRLWNTSCLISAQQSPFAPGIVSEHCCLQLSFWSDYYSRNYFPATFCYEKQRNSLPCREQPFGRAGLMESWYFAQSLSFSCQRLALCWTAGVAHHFSLQACKTIMNFMVL